MTTLFLETVHWANETQRLPLCLIDFFVCSLKGSVKRSILSERNIAVAGGAITSPCYDSAYIRSRDGVQGSQLQSCDLGKCMNANDALNAVMVWIFDLNMIVWGVECDISVHVCDIWLLYRSSWNCKQNGTNMHDHVTLDNAITWLALRTRIVDRNMEYECDLCQP